MVELNSTVSFLQPYFSTVEEVIGTLSLFVGGIFGIYLIMLIVRLVFFQRIWKMFKGLKSQMTSLENKIDKLGKKK
jgi:uncharacterized membrane protein|tara:strand:+ start:114 stop:341 length:228 start_codon:yes stop_codon:yes gene_type:complete